MTSVVTLKREAFRTGQSWAIGDVLHQTENRMRSAHATHLGYPYNLVGYSPVPASLGDYLVNNLGDPYVGSHYGSQTCDLEREAVAWLMDCGSATITMRSGPEFFQGRSLGHPVVRGRERLFRAPRTLSPDAEPGGSPRLAASGSGAGTGEVLSLSRHPVMEWKELVGGTGWG
jgi:hypothetical protein